MTSSFLFYMNKCYEKKQKQINENFKLTQENKIHFTLHQLRHSFCTMCYYSGIGIKEAQELMGHSSADMVYDVYTHLDMEKGAPYDKLNKCI